MNTGHNLEKARMQLILAHPFFATLAMSLKLQEALHIPTHDTDGVTLFYNPSFFLSLSPTEIMTAIAHQVLHISLHHLTRRNGRDKHKWNQATDYVINETLHKSGFTLPKNALFNKVFFGKSAEQIYKLLPDEPAKPGASDTQPSGTSLGQFSDPPPSLSNAEMEAQAEYATLNALGVAKNQGSLPSHLEAVINARLQAVVNWKEVLAQFMATLAKNDYTWKRPSPKYLYLQLYLPTLESNEIDTIIIVVDTSGSIDQHTLNQCAAEIQEIITSLRLSLQIIYVDACIQHIQHVDPDEPLLLQPKGRGGTNFRPAFTYLEQQQINPAALIYLTDGVCNYFPQQAPDYPVLWGQFGNYNFQPPFGQVMSIH